MSTVKEDKEFFELLGKTSQLKEGSKKYKAASEKLRDLWMGMDRVRIRKYPTVEHAKLMKMFLPIRNFLHTDYIFEAGSNNTEIFDFAEDNIDGLSRSDQYYAITRYFELEPPYVKLGSKIPKKIADLYAESRMCFVHGQFSAAIVLCRAIIENILKDKFKASLSLHPPGKYKSKYWTAGITLEYLFKDKKQISKTIHGKGKWIAGYATSILHKSRVLDEKNALKVIGYTKDFLEEIYSR